MNTETTYQDTLEYLYSFIDYSLTHSFPAPENFDLDRLRAFLDQLGNPHKAYPVIHIAGTKGKGSVAALCASALRAGGYRVGLYTSPHLQDYAERIQVNGKTIPHPDLIDLVNEIRPVLDKGTRLTTFEITTALAFLYFSRQGATAVVAEVGLGGRLDATNVVQPAVSVITSISYDHTSVLGETLPEIAFEKAGIIKPHIPVITAPQAHDVLPVIRKVAAERQTDLIEVGVDFLYQPHERSLQGQSLYLWTADETAHMGAFLAGQEFGGWRPLEISIPLLGDHQLENAAIAYAALQTAHARGLPLDRSALLAGLAQVEWPGRFEVLNTSPPLVVDSAHNRDSAQKLCAALDDYFPGRSIILVFGASHDKDIDGMLDELLPRAAQVVFTRSYHPRAIEPLELAEHVGNYEGPVHVVPAIEDALERGLSLVDKDEIVLVTGSLFTVAGARDTWYNHLKARYRES